MDLLAANQLARAFYAEVYADPQRPELRQAHAAPA
jgi:hypothetical protein